MGQNKRRALYAITGISWGAMVATAFTTVDVKIYHAIWLAVLMASLWSLLVVLTRPDHGLLARALITVAANRVEGAMREQERQCPPYPPQEMLWADTPPRGARF